MLTTNRQSLVQSGTLLVTSVESGTVTLFNEADLKQKVELAVGKYPHEVVVTPNGKYALVSNFGNLSATKPGSTLRSIDIENGKILEVIHLDEGSRPHGIVFTSDRQALVTAQGIQSLLIIDFKEGFTEAAVTKKIALPGKGAHMVTVDKEKNYAYVANMDSGSICKIDLNNLPLSKEGIQELKIGRHAEGLTLTQDGKFLLVTNRVDNKLAVINTADMTLNKMLKTRLGPVRVELFNGGKSALIIDAVAGKAEVLDLETLNITRAFKTTNAVSHKHGFLLGVLGLLPVPINAAVKDSDQTVYITNLYAGNVTHIDLAKGKILERFEASTEPDGINLSSCHLSLRK